METNSFKIRKFSGLNQDWFSWKSDFMNSMWILDLGEVLETPTQQIFNPTQVGGNLFQISAAPQPPGFGAQNQLFTASPDLIHPENIKFYGATPPRSLETLDTTLRTNESELEGEIKDTAPTNIGASTLKISDQSDKPSASSDISDKQDKDNSQQVTLEMEEQSPQVSQYQKQVQEVIQQQNAQIIELKNRIQQVIS